MERTVPTKVVVITVSNTDGGRGDYLNNREFPDGTAWSLDDHGNLSVYGGSTLLGTVAAGRWVSVEHSVQ